MYDTKILLCRITNMPVRLVTTGIFKCLCYITSILLHTYFKALKLYQALIPAQVELNKLSGLALNPAAGPSHSDRKYVEGNQN